MMSLLLRSSLFVLVGCTGQSQWEACESDADCGVGETCPTMTKICSPTCENYDDCYGMGLDAVCYSFPDGKACAFNCPKSVDSGFRCEEYELGWLVVSCGDI